MYCLDLGIHIPIFVACSPPSVRKEVVKAAWDALISCAVSANPHQVPNDSMGMIRSHQMYFQGYHSFILFSYLMQIIQSLYTLEQKTTTNTSLIYFDLAHLVKTQIILLLFN